MNIICIYVYMILYRDRTEQCKHHKTSSEEPIGPGSMHQQTGQTSDRT